MNHNTSSMLRTREALFSSEKNLKIYMNKIKAKESHLMLVCYKQLYDEEYTYFKQFLQKSCLFWQKGSYRKKRRKRSESFQLWNWVSEYRFSLNKLVIKLKKFNGVEMSRSFYKVTAFFHSAELVLRCLTFAFSLFFYCNWW